MTQGTPTNNTEQAASGFTTDYPGHDRSFRLILGEPQFQTGDGSNGDELSKALGLPPNCSHVRAMPMRASNGKRAT